MKKTGIKLLSASAMVLASVFLLSACGDEVEVYLPYQAPTYAPYEDEDWDDEDDEDWDDEDDEDWDDEDWDDEDDEDLDDEDWDDEEEPVEELPPVFSPGVVTGSSYENQTLGIGFTAPDGWTFSSAEEIAGINGMAEAATVDTATAFLAEPVEYIDMDVISGGFGNEVSISVINSTFIASDDMSQVAADTNEALAEQLTSSGYEDVTVNVEQREFLGEVVFANTAYCVYQGTQVSEMQIHSQKNGYFYTITFMFFGDNRPDDVMGNFYAVVGEAA